MRCEASSPDLKAELLEKRLKGLNGELERLATQIESLKTKERDQRSQRDDIKRAIAENGGDRIEALTKDISDKQALKSERRARAQQYGRIAREAGLPEASEADTFLQNRHALVTQSDAARAQSAELQNAITDETVLLRQSKVQHSEICQEIESLEGVGPTFQQTFSRFATTCAKHFGLMRPICLSRAN